MVKRRINTRVVIDIETGRVLERDCFEHEGEIAECSGGGSGGGSSTTTTTLPAWLQPYAENFISSYQGQVYDENGVRQMPGNLNQQIAGFNPTQTNAMSNIVGMTPGVQNLANLGAGQSAATLSGAYLYPQTNPYLDATYNQAARNLTDTYRTATAPSILASAQSSGNMGGSALDEAMALSRYDLGQNLGNLATSIYGGNYANERSNQLNTLNQLPNTISAAYAPQQAALGVGAQQQQQAQTQFDTNYTNALNQTQYPYQILSGFGGALGQAGMGSGTSTTKAGNSGGK